MALDKPIPLFIFLRGVAFINLPSAPRRKRHSCCDSCSFGHTMPSLGPRHGASPSPPSLSLSVLSIIMSATTLHDAPRLLSLVSFPFHHVRRRWHHDVSTSLVPSPPLFSLCNDLDGMAMDRYRTPWMPLHRESVIVIIIIITILTSVHKVRTVPPHTPHFRTEVRYITPTVSYCPTKLQCRASRKATFCAGGPASKTPDILFVGGCSSHFKWRSTRPYFRTYISLIDKR